MRRSRVLAVLVILVMVILLVGGAVAWLPDQPDSLPQSIDGLF